jgi:2-(1,2-epoxy-1,2-dihydrophenyl)acetyl-CoA isomerase
VTLVRVDSADRIATVTLNRPDRLNALSNALSADLVAALKRVAADDSVGAVIITGAGRAFCAGGDIEEMRQLVDGEVDRTAIAELIGRGGEAATILREMPKASIAAINGAAAGGGAGLARACDLRIAADSATFGIVFNRLGLVPDWSCTYFLPRLVGTAKALEMTFDAGMIEAAEALRLGIFNRVVPAADLMNAARDQAARLAAKPPLALKLAREAIYGSTDMTLAEVLAVEVRNQLRCFGTKDAAEGIRAFLEKRKPAFRGL